MPVALPERLYMLAFDHRGSFQAGLLGITGAPTRPERERISEVKRLIFEGLRQAIADGARREAAGLLVDEEFGADIARRAKADGLWLAMPVERSGQLEFDFEFGDEFAEHVEAFDPAFAKVLVRFNPDSDPQMNERQLARLRKLSRWLRRGDRRLLFELLVPAEAAQLRRLEGDNARFDRELRPQLLVEAISQLQAAGVEPDIWKIEGLDYREDCRRVAAQARSGGRGEVACIVLGRGADEEAVVRWLQQAAGVPGFIGFAVGRTLWFRELSDYLARRIGGEEVVNGIAINYLRMIEAYETAEARSIMPPPART